MTTSWNNGLPKPSQNTRKHTAGKIRMRWSNHNIQFNPIKTNRYNMLGTKQTDMNKIDVIQPVPKRVCKCFSPTCSYCKLDTPHPSPIHSDWSSKDWDSNKAKAKEQKSLIDFEPPKPDSDKALIDQTTDMRKVILVDDIPFQNLTIGQDKPKEEPLETTDTLVPPPVMVTDIVKPDNTVEDTEEGLMECKERLQKEEEEYAIYIGMLSEEE